MLDGVELAGDGTVADMVWARPSVNVLGIDCPPVVGSTPSLQASARARISMRIPAGIDPGDAQDALAAHLEARTPLAALVEIEREGTGAPFAAVTDGPAYRAIERAMKTAFGAETTTAGQGGSIPLCNVLADTFPDAEIILLGVEEPLCGIHAPNESVDPSEIENMALAEALFLREYAGR